LVSVGVLWGVLRTTVDNLKEQTGKLEKNVDRLEGMFLTFREDVRVRLAGLDGAGKATVSRPVARASKGPTKRRPAAKSKERK